MIEIICAIIGSSVFTLWLTKAFDKFNRLKTEHKQHAKEFVKLTKDASDAVEKGIMANEKIRMLVIEGQTIDDEVSQFTNTWKQFLKCIIKPF